MNISSTPFIRNDYWPDYNDIDILNKRIDEAENETSLVNSRLTNDIENVSNNLNSYKNELADTVITNNIIVNNLNANYAVGKYANFANTNTDNAYIENLTVNKPVFDITLNTPHVENITSIGGNFYDANLFNVTAAELFVNTQPKPVTSSAVLGYDSEGRVIPIKAAFEVGFPENANYLFTDQHGTVFPGTAETEVNASDNLITSNAVYNALANVNNSFNNVNNSFNNVNSTANNLLNNVDYLKNIVESSLLPANITGWNSSTYPVIIQGITEFAVEPLSADYYPISPVSDRIRFNGNYYENNNNNYVKQNVITYNTYDDNISVSWDSKFIGETTLDEETFEEITVWKTNSGTIATSGYYLSVDKKPDDTYIVQLLNLTFNAGVYSGNIIFDALYKLPSDFNFQDNVTYYLKNGNNFEGLKVNQGQCTFTTDPTTDNNFYIYQKGADWSYPNTVSPSPTPDLMTDSSGTILSYSAADYPLYTGIETMTAYVGDKAKLSVSGTKATLALPGLYWTKANMDMAFYKCSSFNQKMIIQNSVTSMVSTFEGCSSFNQPDMLIYSQNITNMTNAFRDCHINNVHIPASVPKSTSNFMYNCLVNGNTGITFSAANIFNDLN